MAKVGKDLVAGEQQPLDLSFTDGGISWTEGDLLSAARRRRSGPA